MFWRERKIYNIYEVTLRFKICSKDGTEHISTFKTIWAVHHWYDIPNSAVERWFIKRLREDAQKRFPTYKLNKIFFSDVHLIKERPVHFDFKLEWEDCPEIEDIGTLIYP